MFKIRLQKIFFWNLQQMSKVTRLFCWHQDFVHKELSAPAPGLCSCGKTLKMCIKSEFKEICLKLATDGRSDKGFLLTSKVCPQRVFCPSPGALYKYRTRFWRDHFETCNIWAKRKCLWVVFKILSPVDCLPLPRAIYIWWNMKKMYLKLYFRAIFFKPATNGQSDKGLLLRLKVVPKWLSALTSGLYTYIKSLKMAIKSDFFF